MNNKEFHAQTNDKESAECCQKCVFVHAMHDQGVCRLEPPTVHILPVQETLARPGHMQLQCRSTWPPVHPTEGWCGQFMSRSEPDMEG